MTPPPSVDLRDYIEEQITAERRHRDVLRDEDRRLREAERDSIERAMAVWTEEVKRRLVELNNAHERAERIAATVVSRDVFDGKMKELQATLDRHEKTLTTSEGQSKGVGLTGQTIFQFLVAAGVIVSIALSFLK